MHSNLNPSLKAGTNLLTTMIKNVIKRDGRKVDFNNQKIVAAILKAMAVTEKGEDIVLAAKIADGNEASIRLFAKCGYSHCGTLHQWIQSGAKRLNMMLFEKKLF